MIHDFCSSSYVFVNRYIDPSLQTAPSLPNDPSEPSHSQHLNQHPCESSPFLNLSNNPNENNLKSNRNVNKHHQLIDDRIPGPAAFAGHHNSPVKTPILPARPPSEAPVPHLSRSPSLKPTLSKGGRQNIVNCGFKTNSQNSMHSTSHQPHCFPNRVTLFARILLTLASIWQQRERDRRHGIKDSYVYLDTTIEVVTRA